MKISYLFSALGQTGGSIVLYNFMDKLVERGHEVYAIGPFFAEKWEAGRWKENIKGGFAELPRDSYIKKLRRDITKKSLSFLYSNEEKVRELETFYYVKRLTEQLLKNWIPSDFTVSTSCWTAFAGYCLSEKTIPLYHMQHFEELFFHEKPARLLARSTYFLPLVNISNSSWLRHTIKKIFKKSTFLLNPGIDMEIFSPSKNPGDKYKPGKNWKLVSYMAETEWKGFKDAIKAVKKAREALSKKGIKIDWILYGADKPAEVDTEFEYRGKVFGKDLAKLYSEADILLLPSWYESFPLPPIEAMACGTAVITTRYGTEDYAFDGQNSLVLPRDIDAMAEKLIFAVENPDQMLKMVEKGLETVKLFTWDKRADELEKILQDIQAKHIDSPDKLIDDLAAGNFTGGTYEFFKDA